MDKAKKTSFRFKEKTTKKKEFFSSLCCISSRFSRASLNNNHSLTTRDALVKKMEETDDDANRETRAEGRDLWSLIVRNDDICFTHILPRLNSTDVKILYEVNSETRKLVKRSSRAGDLRKRFKIEEMSSISTLEFAWEHKSLWPSWLGETSFCSIGILLLKLKSFPPIFSSSSFNTSFALTLENQSYSFTWSSLMSSLPSPLRAGTTLSIGEHAVYNVNVNLSLVLLLVFSAISFVVVFRVSPRCWWC
jgi:hypothetical protein